MTVHDARRWLIVASLVLTGTCFVFFLAAPVLGYHLEFSQSFQLLEIVLPVFLGYLGGASHFVFGDGQSGRRVRLKEDLAGLLIKGPVYLFGLLLFVGVAVFGWANSIHATAGRGMSVNELAHVLTTALGLLSVTTNVAVAYLFSRQLRADATEPQQPGAVASRKK